MTGGLIIEFFNRFKKEPGRIFTCPGRINLIGEHIDYNGGKVMPCAISMGTILAVDKNTDKKLRFYSMNFPETAVLHLQTTYGKTGNEWFNYPLGVINHFTENEMNVSGMDMLFQGNLPIGAGLSSSASIEVLMAFAINEMFGLGITRKEIAVLSKKVENEFIGVQCGIMDQFAVAMGQKAKAILLNCDTLEYEYIPLELGDYALVIINTNKQRNLPDSKYNERFTECGHALKALKKKLTVQHLCDISPSEFNEHRQLINNAVLERRALHVISENARVAEAADALKAGDLQAFGNLMYDSHHSLKELYEVTGKELDTIVEFCKSFEGCIGARMTGAGFGGCAFALIAKERLENFENLIMDYYEKIIGYKPAVFITEAVEGVRELPMR